MAGTTDRYGFAILGPGEHLSDNDYQILGSDQRVKDLLIALGAELHRHTGASSQNSDPTIAPSLSLDTSQGALQGGTRYYYRYGLVNPLGFETGGSPEAYIDTPAKVATPGAPSLVTATTGGTLLPGQYLYVLSAYKTATTLETASSPAVYITVPVTTSTNVNTLTMPMLPTGATGFNVYRQKPGANALRYLTSTTGSTVTDDGSFVEDPVRGIPAVNNTNSTNAVQATVPTLAAGWHWRLYRTVMPNDYRKALVHEVIEETVPGTIDASYMDLGTPTGSGRPKGPTTIPGSPPKVNLVTEVTGILPEANGGGGDIQTLFWMETP